MMLRPTPPQPITATDSPGCTSAVLSAAPSPVTTAQPRMQASSRGMSLLIGVTARSSSRI